MSKLDPMVEIFLYETEQLLGNLEDILLAGERQGNLNSEQIDEVFRVMHTIKGSASMMSFDGLEKLAHALEDLFSQIRDGKMKAGAWDDLFEIVLTSADHIKADVSLIQLGQQPEGQHTETIEKVHTYMNKATSGDSGGGSSSAPAQASSADAYGGGEDDLALAAAMGASYYKLKAIFEPGCQMENMRAFGMVNSLTPLCVKYAHFPSDLMDEAACTDIQNHGFTMYMLSAENPDVLESIAFDTMFLQSASLIPISDDNDDIPESIRVKPKVVSEEKGDAQDMSQIIAEAASKQNFISVNVNKLDKLLALVGEIVTTESMVTKNPEIETLQIESFERAGQQLRKQINELQDIVMSIRMIPVSTTFHKMHRVVRDMSKKIGKEIDLVIIGEETEVDKNIIDTLSDPLMHLIRNAVDHGIESSDIRRMKGKSAAGKVTLEARNTGGDVLILVSDDGAGLDRESIIKKAVQKGLINKPENEISEKEAFSYIFLPGFSTNEDVTEYSGRGVGMDVVRRNIEKVGGEISIESAKDAGTTIILRIPLTLAIIEGMKLRVGKLLFIVPMLSIQESFKPNTKDVFLDPDGSEMIMIRGECYPIIRLHRMFNIAPEMENLADGILIMIRTDTAAFCLYADQLIGEQQAVIKPLPLYIQKHNNGMHGIGGCSVLGDGSISYIVDIQNLLLGLMPD